MVQGAFPITEIALVAAGDFGMREHDSTEEAVLPGRGGDVALEGMGDSERAAAIEAIKVLKARYFRLTDAKRFDELESLFAPDALVHYTDHQAEPLGAKAMVALAREALKGAVSVHYGYMPEIEILSPATAKAIWGMADRIWWDEPNPFNAREMGGWGHEHDTYVKLDGRWLIQTTTLFRLKSYTIDWT